MKGCLLISLLISMATYIYAQKESGGTNAPNTKYRYQAALRHNSKFICGASIISQDWLLTAAHCVNLIKSPTDATVLVGTVYVDGTNGTEYAVKKILQHEKYDQIYDHAHDIALIQVSKNIQFNQNIQPVKLPKNQRSISYENSKALLAGWGTVANNSIPSKILQHVQLRVINLVQCAKKWRQKRKRTILKTHLCTSGLNSQNVVSRGDSGGALVNNNVQIGILSFAWSDLPDVFTRVISYLPWIRRHTNL